MNSNVDNASSTVNTPPMENKSVNPGIGGLKRLEAEGMFVKSFTVLSDFIHAGNVERGFWEEGKNRNKAEAIALMHSELSEALESIRKDFNKPDDHVPQHTNVAVELADTIVRIMDFAAGFDINVAAALVDKVRYNETRPFKHGKNF